MSGGTISMKIYLHGWFNAAWIDQSNANENLSDQYVCTIFKRQTFFENFLKLYQIFFGFSYNFYIFANQSARQSLNKYLVTHICYISNVLMSFQLNQRLKSRLQEMPIQNINELYKRIEKLGEGSYAVVYKSESRCAFFLKFLPVNMRY